MSRYPRKARAASIKCIQCNAPVVRTVDGEYVCVECGGSPVKRRSRRSTDRPSEGVRVSKTITMDADRTARLELSFESTWRVPVFVRVRVPTPEPVTEADFRVRPGSEAETWTSVEAGLESNRVLGPGESVESTILLEDPGWSGLSAFEPTVQVVVPVDSEATVDDPGTALVGGVPDEQIVRGASPPDIDLSLASATADRSTAAVDPVDAPRSGTLDVDGQIDQRGDDGPDRADGRPASGLLLPPDSDTEPVLTIVMPTLNERRGIGESIDAAIDAIDALGVPGEIIVSDSSEDETPEIAEDRGAIVVKPDRRGYGYAYRYAFERARGEYIAMGDADTTYDFRELPALFEVVASGDADLAIGSRFSGTIERGAMPWLHRYVGNPLLTRFLNAFYDAGVTDAHSGFRVLRRDALDDLNLRSDGMEFASEMIMAAGANGLSIEERPINYHRREGQAKINSFRDGWNHVKFMLLNAPNYLFVLPGLVVGLVGVLLSVASVVGAPSLTLESTVAGGLSLLVGHQLVVLGAFSGVASEPIKSPDGHVFDWLGDGFELEHGALVGLALIGIGVLYVASLAPQGLGGTGRTTLAPNAVVATTLVVLGVQTVFASFCLDSLSQGLQRRLADPAGGDDVGRGGREGPEQ